MMNANDIAALKVHLVRELGLQDAHRMERTVVYTAVDSFFQKRNAEVWLERMRQILFNNYQMFMDRAQRTSDWSYKADCIAYAKETEKQYEYLTGQPMNIPEL